jgi:hypothetical protein
MGALAAASFIAAIITIDLWADHALWDFGFQENLCTEVPGVELPPGSPLTLCLPTSWPAWNGLDPNSTAVKRACSFYTLVDTQPGAMQLLMLIPIVIGLSLSARNVFGSSLCFPFSISPLAFTIAS